MVEICQYEHYDYFFLHLMRRISSHRSSFSGRFFRLYQNLFIGFIRSSVSRKILYVSLVFGIFFLFTPWVSLQVEGSDPEFYNAFSMICGGVGYFICLLFFAMFFVLGYAADREKIHAKMSHIISEHTIILCTGAIMFSLSLIIFTSLLGYSTLTTGNLHINTKTSGIVFEILVSILILFSGLLAFKEKGTLAKKRVYIENASSETAHMQQYDAILGKQDYDDDVNNMKLPI